MPGFIIGNQDGRGPNPKAEFHRSHRWIIENLGVPSGISGGTATDSPRYYAKTLELPSLSLEEEIVDGGSVRYKLAKKATWDNITLTFYDVHGLFPVFHAWQKLIWTQERGIGLANDYKGRPSFLLLDGMGEKQQTYTLIGAYPVKVSHGEMSYATSDIKLLSVTYSFDWAEMELIT